MTDNVNHPAYYTSGAVETIDLIEYIVNRINPLTDFPNPYMGFLAGNAVKYISRAHLKGNTLEDYKKARWYLNRLQFLDEFVLEELPEEDMPFWNKATEHLSIEQRNVLYNIATNRYHRAVTLLDVYSEEV